MSSRHRESDSRLRAPREVDILGVRIHDVTRNEAVSIMEDLVRQGGTHLVCTPNVDHLVIARRDEMFRRALMNAHLVVPDGMGVIYLSRLLGYPLSENVGGRLLVGEFGRLSAERGYRLFLLGGSTQAVLDRAAERLRAQFPGAHITGTYSPPCDDEFDAAETNRMIAAVSQRPVDVLFIGLGTPKQEKWAWRNLERIPARVVVGVGIAFDMLAGHVRTPPQWMTNVGLEWSWRLVQEPRRLSRRYLLRDPIVLWWAVRARFGGGSRRGRES